MVRLDPKQKFSFRLRFLCIATGTTPGDLGKVTGRSHATVSHWWNGSRVPGDVELEKMADHFEVSVHYLKTGAPDPNPGSKKLKLNDKNSFAGEVSAKRISNNPQLVEEAQASENAVMEEQAEYGAGDPKRAILDYVRNYLEKAEQHPEGLAVARYKVKRYLQLTDFDPPTE